MKYKLNELNNKISLEDSQEQFLDEISIKRLASFVKIKLESEIQKVLNNKPDDNDTDDNNPVKNNLDDRLGVFTRQFLNRLHTIKIQGNYWLNPFNFKNDTQKKGTTSFDISKYEQQQIIPCILMNSKNEILKGGKESDQFYLVLNIPAIGAQIDDKNIDEFKKLFKLPKNFGNDDFKTLTSFNNIDLHFIKIKHDELKSIDKMFLANNKTQINRIDIQSKSALRKSTAKKENPGEISDQNNELQTNEIKLNYNNIINEKLEINMKYIHKQKLSNILFENTKISEINTKNNLLINEGIFSSRKKDKELEWLDDIKDRTIVIDDHVYKAIDLFNNARNEFNKGNYNKAFNDFETLHQEYNNKIQFVLYMANCKYEFMVDAGAKATPAREALELFKQYYSQTNDNNAILFFKMGHCEYELDHNEDAFGYYNKAFNLDKDVPHLQEFMHKILEARIKDVNGETDLKTDEKTKKLIEIYEHIAKLPKYKDEAIAKIKELRDHIESDEYQGEASSQDDLQDKKNELIRIINDFMPDTYYNFNINAKQEEKFKGVGDIITLFFSNTNKSQNDNYFIKEFNAIELQTEYIQTKTEIVKEFRAILNSNTKSGETEFDEQKLNEFLDYYGQDGNAIINKFKNILISLIKDDTEHVPMKGTYQKDKKSRGDFISEINDVFTKEFKKLSPILNSDFNIRSKKFIGNKYLFQIAEAIKENKALTIDLDKIISEQLLLDNNEIININAVLNKLKEDKSDLKVDIENLINQQDMSDEDFLKDVERTLLKNIANSIQGIIGNNSTLIDNKIYSKNLLNEISSTTFNLAAFIAVGISLFLSSSFAPLIASVIAIGVGTKKFMDDSKILETRRKYKNNADMFSQTIINESIDYIRQCCTAVVVNMHVSALLGIEEQLKQKNITLQYTSQQMQNLHDDIKKSSNLRKKKDNLNDLGKKIYSEIIDEAYKFKTKNPIGKYINESSIENMLIKTIYDYKIRNKFSKLMDLLQKEELHDSLIYKLGLKFLLNESETESSDSIRETFEINRLRTQLATIITKEFNTMNFKNDINNALTREIKNNEKDLPGKFDFTDKSKKEKIVKVLIKVMNKVLGMSRADVKSFFDDQAHLFENKINNKLLLTETQAKHDTFQNLYKIGNDYYIQYISNHLSHAGKTCLIKIPAANLGADGTITTTIKDKALIIGQPADNLINGRTPLDMNEPFNTKIVASAGADTETGVVGFSLEDVPEASFDFQPLAKVAGVISLLFAVLNFVRPILHRNIKTGAEIQKILTQFDWSQIPGVIFAEIICQILLANKEQLEEKNIIITGSLAKSKKPSVESGILASKIKKGLSQAQLETIQEKGISDEQIAASIRQEVSNICIGIVRKYDKQRYSEIIDTADKTSYRDEKDKIRIGGWIRSKRSHEDIVSNIDPNAKQSNRDKSINKQLSSDIDTIINAIISLSKDAKDLNDHKLIITNKLSQLLSEDKQPDALIPVEDLIDALRSTGALIYKSDMDPDSVEFKRAENYFVGTIANFMKHNFNIKVKGVEKYKIMNIQDAIISSTVDEKVEQGQPASPEVEKLTAGTAIPEDKSSSFSIDQLFKIMNAAGSDSMKTFLEFIIRDETLLEELEELQKQPKTLEDAVKFLNEKITKLDFDKIIDIVIKNAAQNNKPEISKKIIKKLFNLISKNKGLYGKIIKPQIEIEDFKSFMISIKEDIKIVDDTFKIDSFKKLNDLVNVFVIDDKSMNYNKLYYLIAKSANINKQNMVDFFVDDVCKENKFDEIKNHYKQQHGIQDKKYKLVNSSDEQSNKINTKIYNFIHIINNLRLYENRKINSGKLLHENRLVDILFNSGFELVKNNNSSKMYNNINLKQEWLNIWDIKK